MSRSSQETDAGRSRFTMKTGDGAHSGGISKGIIWRDREMKEMFISDVNQSRTCSHVSVAGSFITASWQEVSTAIRRRVEAEKKKKKKTFVIFLITVLSYSLQAIESVSHLNVNGSGERGSAMAPRFATTCWVEPVVKTPPEL